MEVSRAILGGIFFLGGEGLGSLGVLGSYGSGRLLASMVPMARLFYRTSSTAQPGGRSFQDRKPIGGWFAGRRWQSDPMTGQKAVGTWIDPQTN